MNKNSKYRKLLDNMEMGVATGKVSATQLYQWILETLDGAEKVEIEIKSYLSTADMENEHYRGLLFSTQDTSLKDIQAQAVTDLISECSYSTQVNGIATSIIDVDSAIKYADKLGEG